MPTCLLGCLLAPDPHRSSITTSLPGGITPVLTNEDTGGQRSEVISPSHTALLTPVRVGAQDSGSRALTGPWGPYLVLQETGWTDLGQGQENSTWAAGPPPWARPGVTQALAVSSHLE